MFASYKHLAATRNAVRVRKASRLSSQQSAVSATWHRPPGRHLSLNALWTVLVLVSVPRLISTASRSDLQHHIWQHAHVAFSVMVMIDWTWGAIYSLCKTPSSPQQLPAYACAYRT